MTQDDQDAAAQQAQQAHEEERRRAEEETAQREQDKINAYAEAMIRRDQDNYWVPESFYRDFVPAAGTMYVRTTAGWQPTEQPKGMERKK